VKYSIVGALLTATIFISALAHADTTPVPIGVSLSTHIPLNANLIPENSIIPQAVGTTTLNSTMTSTVAASSIAALINTLYAQVQALEAQIATLEVASATSTPTTTSTAPITSCTPLTLTRFLSLGSAGSDVSSLQTFLQAHGSYTYPTITGYFGPLTEAAVEAFQDANGIEAVGIVGPKTSAKVTAISSVCEAPSAISRATSASSTIGTTSTQPATTSSTTSIPLSLRTIPSLTFGGGGEGGGGGSPGGSTPPDTTPPSVSLTAPTNGSLVFGSSVVLTATASDNVAVANVQFKVDGVDIGSAITSSPYTTMWNSSGVSDGSHTLYAVAEDTAGNFATSSISVTVRNSPPVITSMSSGTPTTTSATITWTTDENATSTVNYGKTISYGTASSSSAFTTSHSITLTGLTGGTTYHFQVASADAQGNLATSTDQTFTTAYSTQAQQFFSRLATQPTTARAQAYNALIGGLVYAGVWQKLDNLYLFAASDASTSLTNLIQGSFGATTVGSPTFAANNGYTGTNNITDYLETGFDPTVGSPNFSQSSASVFAWKASNPSGDNGNLAGIYNETDLYSPPSGSLFYGQASSHYTNVSNTAANNEGLYEASQISGNLTLYNDGVPLKTAAETTYAPTSGKTAKFLYDGVTTDGATESQLSAGGYGGGLTAADSRNLYTYVNNYLTTIQSGIPTVYPTFSSDIVNNGANNYTPGLARLADGRLIAVYCVGTGSQDSGSIVYQTSSNNGQTWSSATTVVAPASSYGYTDTEVTVLPDGIVLISAMYLANNASSVSPIVIRGVVNNDLSITWSLPIDVPSTFSFPGTTSSILRLSNGTLMLGLYPFNSDNAVHVIFSSDEGQTWSNETTVTTGSGFDESNYVQLESGEIIGILRQDSNGYWMATSTDNGATWSTPTQILNSSVASNPSRPALVLSQGGTLLLVGRFIGPGSSSQTGYTYSTNEGATWSTPQIYFNIGTFSDGTDVYDQGFYDTTTQTAMYVLGQGSFVSSAQMTFQQFSLP
jgi:peptidoglycan hydrolase-like protein with peptidoglycan-binding domain